MTSSLYRAVIFAERAHAGQLRKYTGEDYIVHPFEVAGLVLGIGGSIDMATAALLHDTVEDTCIALSNIEYAFGKK